ncbi:sensor domain-containing diguanylate cyclase [Pseudoalteromonas sp. T1lg75]|uniref:sensor domain-containing diguanylate cyclase n=1 Tax=Pseudoalteromonas sp. T1lg75 TaxID=2077102 RepID=UPI000CF71B8D|nr:diguanylate cyclase [Pseudoalteromonas sp. T1lg75]
MLNKHSLILRLAMVLVLTSLIVGVSAVKYYYQSIYQQEVDKAQRAIEQLHKTVASTASIAAYLKDKDLALEVINGLRKNDIILAAVISSEDELLASGGEHNPHTALPYPLYHPFLADDVVGYIALTPAQEGIQQGARNIAQSSVTLLLIQTSTLLLTFIILAYFIIAKPMARLSAELKQITAGSNNRLTVPFAQHDSEIGEMTKSINNMLAVAESHFSQERALRSEVQELGNRLQLLFEHASSAMILATQQGQIMLYNASTEKLLARLNLSICDSLFELVAQAFKDGDTLVERIRDSLDQDDVARGEYQLLNDTTGQSIWVHILVTRSYAQQQQSYLQIFIHDISSHKQQLAHLNHAASTDKLTGLLNRIGAERELDKRLAAQQNVTLMLIDLDGFKPINDIYGHDAGDEILRYVGQQLRQNLRKDDLCIRWGGDEFVVVVDALEKEQAMQLATKLHQALCQPTTLSNSEQVAVGASIGVAVSPRHGGDFKSLIVAADRAMYGVKRGDKNAVAFAAD